jgi:hypothetical protein
VGANFILHPFIHTLLELDLVQDVECMKKAEPRTPLCSRKMNSGRQNLCFLCSFKEKYSFFQFSDL